MFYFFCKSDTYIKAISTPSNDITHGDGDIAAIGNNFYIFAGLAYSTAQGISYANALTDTQVTQSNDSDVFPSGIDFIYHRAIAIPTDLIYVIGGGPSSDSVDTVYVYIPSLDRFYLSQTTVAEAYGGISYPGAVYSQYTDSIWVFGGVCIGGPNCGDVIWESNFLGVAPTSAPTSNTITPTLTPTDIPTTNPTIDPTILNLTFISNWTEPICDSSLTSFHFTSFDSNQQSSFAPGPDIGIERCVHGIYDAQNEYTTLDVLYIPTVFPYTLKINVTFWNIGVIFPADLNYIAVNDREVYKKKQITNIIFKE